MFTPSDLEIRPPREEDLGEIARLIGFVQREEEREELRRQVKRMFLHPGLWVASGVVICVVGIALDIPPVPASIMVLLLGLIAAKRHFRSYWNVIKGIFSYSDEDLAELTKFYVESEESRFFLVAKHRGRVVGTAAIRESPGMPAIARTCKLWRVFVHPATRRMGIASRLIQESLKRASQRGYRRVALSTHKTNLGAVKLFEANEFRMVSEDVLAYAYPLKYITVNFEKQLEESDHEH